MSSRPRPHVLAVLASLVACGGPEAGTTSAASTGAGTQDTTSSTSTSVDPTTGEAATDADPTTTTGPDTTGGTTGGDPADAYVQLHPDDPRRLIWRGRTFYPLGYYAGAAFNMTGPQWDGDFAGFQRAVMDALAAGGVNYFRVWLNWGNLGDDTAPLEDRWDHHILHPYLRTGPGDAVDGEPRLDLDQFDPEYFARLAEFVDEADARGLVVQLILLDCWHAGFGLKYGFGERDYFAAANNVNGLDFADENAWLDPQGPVFARQRDFVERVVDTLGARGNIVWETCNEKRAGSHATPQDTRDDAFHAALAAVIAAREDALGLPVHRLVVPLDLPEHRTVAGHHTPDPNPNGAEDVATMRARLAGEQFAWAVPLISDNDCCPGEPDAALVRTKAWAALSAGAALDVFNNEMFKPEVLGAANTAEGIRAVGRVGEFLAGLEVDLVGMKPADELVIGDAWTYARAGEEYVVFLPGGGQVELPDLGAATARWWDPRLGEAQDAGPGPVFVAPGPGEWALHVRAR